VKRQWRPGDQVKITIEEAWVQSRPHDGLLIVSVGADEISIDTEEPAVSIELIGIPDWPPQAGDVWGDADGVHWFAMPYSGGYLVMHSDGLVHASVRGVETFLAERLGLKLLFRRGPS